MIKNIIIELYHYLLFYKKYKLNICYFIKIYAKNINVGESEPPRFHMQFWVSYLILKKI